MSLTIILPCAGEGSRLSLGYPKELYAISEEHKLIDFTLEHIIAGVKSGVSDIDVSVVITKTKENVYEHVSKKLSKFNINVNKVYFNNNYREWPGSVFSAKETFSENNVVLLPDSYMMISEKNQFYNLKGKTIIEMFQSTLEKDKAVFAYIKTKDIKKLSNLGAMNIEHDKINLFKDKPKKDIHLYNGFWTCYGFKREVAYKLYEFLLNSVYNISDNLIPPFNFGGFPIFSFADLGTWNSIEEYLLSKSYGGSNITGKCQ